MFNSAIAKSFGGLVKAKVIPPSEGKLLSRVSFVSEVEAVLTPGVSVIEGPLHLPLEIKAANKEMVLTSLRKLSAADAKDMDVAASWLENIANEESHLTRENRVGPYKGLIPHLLAGLFENPGESNSEQGALYLAQIFDRWPGKLTFETLFNNFQVIEDKKKLRVFHLMNQDQLREVFYYLSLDLDTPAKGAELLNRLRAGLRQRVLESLPADNALVLLSRMSQEEVVDAFSNLEVSKSAEILNAYLALEPSNSVHAYWAAQALVKHNKLQEVLAKLSAPDRNLLNSLLNESKSDLSASDLVVLASNSEPHELLDAFKKADGATQREALYAMSAANATALLDLFVKEDPKYALALMRVLKFRVLRESADKTRYFQVYRNNALPVLERISNDSLAKLLPLMSVSEVVELISYLPLQEAQALVSDLAVSDTNKAVTVLKSLPAYQTASLLEGETLNLLGSMPYDHYFSDVVRMLPFEKLEVELSDAKKEALLYKARGERVIDRIPIAQFSAYQSLLSAVASRSLHLIELQELLWQAFEKDADRKKAFAFLVNFKVISLENKMVSLAERGDSLMNDLADQFQRDVVLHSPFSMRGNLMVEESSLDKKIGGLLRNPLFLRQLSGEEVIRLTALGRQYFASSKRFVATERKALFPDLEIEHIRAVHVDEQGVPLTYHVITIGDLDKVEIKPIVAEVEEPMSLGELKERFFQSRGAVGERQKVRPDAAFFRQAGLYPISELAALCEVLLAINGGNYMDFGSVSDINNLGILDALADVRFGDRVGWTVVDGEELNNPIFNRPALITTEDGRLHIEQVVVKELILEDQTITWDKVNPAKRNGNPVLYNSLYGLNTPQDDRYVDVTIINNKVVAVTDGGGASIPPTGVIVSLSKNNSLKNRLSKGTIVKFGNTFERKNIPKVKHARACGPLLVKDGQPSLENISDLQDYGAKDKSVMPISLTRAAESDQYFRAARTMVMVDKEGKVSFVLVEGKALGYGRPEESAGVSFAGLADLALSLGAEQAFAFDGGGASNFTYRQIDRDGNPFYGSDFRANGGSDVPEGEGVGSERSLIGAIGITPRSF